MLSFILSLSDDKTAEKENKKPREKDEVNKEKDNQKEKEERQVKENKTKIRSSWVKIEIQTMTQ